MLAQPKKKRQLNSPALQFTDIIATISAQNFTQWSLWKPERVSVRKTNSYNGWKLSALSHCTSESSLQSATLKSIVIYEAVYHVTVTARFDWSEPGAVVPSSGGGRLGNSLNWVSFTLTCRDSVMRFYWIVVTFKRTILIKDMFKCYIMPHIKHFNI